MRRLVFIFFLLATASCAETVRCPDGQVFDESGNCIPIADGGPDPADGG